MLVKLASAVLVAVALLVAERAPAQVVDLSTIKCKDFIELPKETVNAITMWLDGYYSEDDAPPIVDFDKMGENSKKLGEYCGKNPGHSVITAADKVMGNGK